MGFEDNEEIKSDNEAADVDMEEEKSAGEGQRVRYKEHLELSELILGIKEGRFFQGRLNVSRLTINEATVNVSGLN